MYGGGGAIGVLVFRLGDEGEHMAVDEKCIGKEFYTVLTDADTGRIAMMCRSVDYQTVVVKLLLLGCEALDRVRAVTMDLSTRFCTMPRRENVRYEETNAKIQIAAIKNRGSRDLDFFLYRVSNILLAFTSKIN